MHDTGPESNSLLLVAAPEGRHNKDTITKEGVFMETKEILKTLRENHKLTQDQLAGRVMVTRQAVSRWENGETLPNTDTLRML